MSKRASALGLALLLQGSAGLQARAGTLPKTPVLPPSANHLGEPPPGDVAVPFAPGILTTGGKFVQNAAFSPDGTEFYFTVTNGTWDRFDIWTCRFKGGAWTAPAKADFLQGKDTFELCFDANGKTVYFSGGHASNTDIWRCERKGDGWGPSTRLPECVNTPGYEMFASISRKKTLFFGRNGGIYVSPQVQGTFATATNIGSPVDLAGQNNGDPYVSPQEDYLIFLSVNRTDGLGQADLYITFKKNDGTWTNPKNLGPRINTSAFECAPALTPDGKYFLFTRRKRWVTDEPSRIYWIKADFIEQLRHSNFAPYAGSAVPPLSWTVGQPVRYGLPAGTFVDDDGSSTLTYTSASGQGGPLPTWLSFDPATQTFSGTPAQPGTLRLNLVATDPSGATASMLITVDVR